MTNNSLPKQELETYLGPYIVKSVYRESSSPLVSDVWYWETKVFLCHEESGTKELVASGDTLTRHWIFVTALLENGLKGLEDLKPFI